jgi:hypothetical protein
MPKYNHAVTIAFEVISEHPNGDDITADQLATACLARVHNIMRHDPSEMLEACLPPYDTHEEEVATSTADDGTVFYTETGEPVEEE